MSSGTRSNSEIMAEKPPNPYVGPRAFMRGETLYGRDREVRRLLNLLIAERIVLLYSPSGAGKTSLIQSALMPELEDEEFIVSPVVRVSALDTFAMQPEMRGTPSAPPPVVNRYLGSLMLSLEEAVPDEQQLDHTTMMAMNLDAYMHDLMPRMVPSATTTRSAPTRDETDATNDTDATDDTDDLDEAPHERRIVLIFDQFEEILTQDATDHEAKRAFFEQVGTMLQNKNCWALFSLREDFVAALDPYARYIPTRFAATFRLDLLQVDAARKAIQEPAALAGVTFSDSAATRLVDDLRQVQVIQPDGSTLRQAGPYIEPVQLQVVCYRLWEKLAPGKTEITEHDIESIGNVDYALADYYAERVATIAEQTGVAERTIRDWIDHRLITEQGIRSQVMRQPDESDGLDNDAIELLINAHLVRAEKRRGVVWFELAHDRLVEPIQTNNISWRTAHLSMLQEQAAIWANNDRPRELLLRDQTLEHAEIWARNNATELTDTERLYLSLSQDARAQKQREQGNRRKILVLSAFGIGAVLIILVLLLQVQKQETQSETIAKETALIANQTAEAAKETAQAAKDISQSTEKQLLLLQETISTLQNSMREAYGNYDSAWQTAVAAQETATASRRQPTYVQETSNALAQTSQAELEIAQEQVTRIQQTEAVIWSTQQSLADIRQTELATVTPYPMPSLVPLPTPTRVSVPTPTPRKLYPAPTVRNSTPTPNQPATPTGNSSYP